jgi:hypothetical protein
MRKDSIAGLSLMALALLWAAYYFRYQPIVAADGSFAMYDRLTSRICAPPGRCGFHN